MASIFKTELFDSVIEPPNSTSFNLIGAKLPTSQDLYFMAKWHEIFECYCKARVFLWETQNERSDWQHWFNLSNDDTDNEPIYTFTSYMYETALIEYNIIVDLSWTMTYVSAEYLLYQTNENDDLSAKEIFGMMTIEDAYDVIRIEESNVTKPEEKNGSFAYLRKMVPQYATAINMIIEFWKHFSNTDIRHNYNYIKHRGKPLYKEIIELDETRFFELTINNQRFPTEIGDVQKTLPLYDSIQELINFDNDKLFPYLSKLIAELKRIVNPSPYIIG